MDEFIRRCDINVFINNAAGVHLSKSLRRTTDEEVDEDWANSTSQIKVLNRVYNYFVRRMME